MTKRGPRLALLVVALLALLARPSTGRPGATLRDGGLGEFRQWFNANRGHVRLVLLLSPT